MRVEARPLEELQGAYLVSVEGIVDSVNVTGFFQSVNRLFKEGARSLIMDLSEASYLSSGALSVIADAFKKAEAMGGKVALCGVSSAVMELLQVVQFDRLFDFYPDTDAAVKDLAEMTS